MKIKDILHNVFLAGCTISALDAKADFATVPNSKLVFKASIQENGEIHKYNGTSYYLNGQVRVALQDTVHGNNSGFEVSPDGKITKYWGAGTIAGFQVPVASALPLELIFLTPYNQLLMLNNIAAKSGKYQNVSLKTVGATDQYYLNPIPAGSSTAQPIHSITKTANGIKDDMKVVLNQHAISAYTVQYLDYATSAPFFSSLPTHVLATLFANQGGQLSPDKNIEVVIESISSLPVGNDMEAIASVDPVTTVNIANTNQGYKPESLAVSKVRRYTDIFAYLSIVVSIAVIWKTVIKWNSD